LYIWWMSAESSTARIFLSMPLSQLAPAGLRDRDGRLPG